MRLRSAEPVSSLKLRVKKTNLYKERSEERRHKFIQEIANLDPVDVVYLDESGIDEILHRAYARAPSNTRVYGEKSGKYIPRTTFIAAYNEGGLKAPFYFQGYTDTVVFNSWVETCLLPDLKPGQTVVLDNASFHKSKRTTELIESVGCKVLFQPPYSPDLNKIEPMWANLKRRLRNTYDHSKSFYQNIESTFQYMCHH